MAFRADPFECLNNRHNPRILCRLLDERDRFMSRRRADKPPSLSSAGSCAGKSIVEIMWEELDTIVERIMTGEEAEDGRDPGRAEGVAMCISIISNPYLPNLPAVREEAIRRFEAAQEEEAS